MTTDTTSALQALADEWTAQSIDLKNPYAWRQAMGRAACQLRVALTSNTPPDYVRVPLVPANCRERLQREGKPYPRSGCEACGKFAPKWRVCGALLSIEKAAPTAEGTRTEGEPE